MTRFIFYIKAVISVVRTILGQGTPCPYGNGGNINDNENTKGAPIKDAPTFNIQLSTLNSFHQNLEDIAAIAVAEGDEIESLAESCRYCVSTIRIEVARLDNNT